MSGEKFLKPYLQEMMLLLKEASIDLNELNVTEFVKSIPLSRKTISKRIKSISNDLKEQTLEDIKASDIGHSLQSDSSTDVEGKEQLVAFAR